MVAAAAVNDADGRIAPNDSASPTFVTPATRPLVPAMKIGSFAEILRVRLLSTAQHRHAPATASAPDELVSPTPPEGQASTTPPALMSAMPSTIRRSAFSWNTTQARSAVSTASRLSSSDASAADARVSPYIRSVGPSTPPAAIAPDSHGHSARDRLIGLKPRSRARRTSQRPIPLPR